MSVIAPLNPVERAAATKATADKFRGRPLDFAAGVTCLHLLRVRERRDLWRRIPERQHLLAQEV